MDNITHHTVEDFVSNPELKLETSRSAPWKNPDQNKSPVKIVVGLLGVLFVFALTPSAETITWMESFFQNKRYFLCVVTYLSGLIAYLVRFLFFATEFCCFRYLPLPTTCCITLIYPLWRSTKLIKLHHGLGTPSRSCRNLVTLCLTSS